MLLSDNFKLFKLSFFLHIRISHNSKLFQKSVIMSVVLSVYWMEVQTVRVSAIITTSIVSKSRLLIWICYSESAQRPAICKMPPNMNNSIDLPPDSLHLSSQVENSCILNNSLESLHTFPICTLFVLIVFTLACLCFYQSEVIYACIGEPSSRSNMPHKLVHPLPCCKLEVKPAVSVRGCETLCLFDSMPSELFFFFILFFFKGNM